MARTPLFSLLQRAARTAQAASTAAEPADEFIQRVHEARTQISRRRFLEVSAGAASALALEGCGLHRLAPVTRAKVPTYGHRANVAIVGAGIAGLSAAWRLQQAGMRVKVYEAQGRVGGRILSLRDHFPDGQVIELGGELIDTPHTHIRTLAAELGIVLDDLSTDDPSLRAEVWHFRGHVYTEAEIARAFWPVAQAIQRDLGELGTDDVTYRTPGEASAFDRMTIAGWLRKNHVSGWLGSLIQVAYTTEMGLETNQQSALNLLTLIGTGQEGFRIYGGSDERYHVRGGNDLIVKRLAQRLDGAIETGSVLEAVGAASDGTFRLTIRQSAATKEVSATHVVLALPVTTLRDVRLDLPLPAVKQRAIRELRYGTNAKLMVGFSERTWRTRHKSNGSVYSDLPFQTTWETTRLQPGKGGVLTNFTGGHHGIELGTQTPAVQADKLARELDGVFPGVMQARAGAKEARFHWPSNPWVRGSYLCFTPGQWTTLRGVMGESVGNLHFAGEHCSLDHQGFMEGGCETGENAARAILRSLGVAAAAPAAQAA
jgi:monoamine oxidase